MIEIEEKWEDTNNISNRGDTIIKVSNMGRIRRKNGTIEDSTLRQELRIDGKLMRIHRFIANKFIPKTDEDVALGRNYIDHIKHNPIGINVNDVRNLRWCTQKENCNFDEARENRSKAKMGNKNHLCKVTSEFGRKYLEHYGYSFSENPKQYHIEKAYYQYHHKCRWE